MFDGVCLLRAWRKLREVLQSWLQTSAEEEQMEKTAVFEELKEVKTRMITSAYVKVKIYKILQTVEPNITKSL